MLEYTPVNSILADYAHALRRGPLSDWHGMARSHI